MTTKYVSDLIRISLTPEHWQTVHDLARENRLTVGEMISDWLNEIIKQILDDAEIISALETEPEP